jgi:hypothetical protein
MDGDAAEALNWPEKFGEIWEISQPRLASTSSHFNKSHRKSKVGSDSLGGVICTKNLELH